MAETGTDYHVEPDGSPRAEPTLGPWRTEGEPSTWIVSEAQSDRHGLPLVVAQAITHDIGEDTAEANAALMAEAWRIPALRAALEAIALQAEGWRAGLDEHRRVNADLVAQALTDAARTIRSMRDIAREALGERTT